MAQLYMATETVQASQVTGTLTDFPALFSRTSAGGGAVPDFRSVGNGGKVNSANGYDLCLYTDSGGALGTMLKMETESYSASAGTVIKWAKIASIATSTVVRWGYGDTGITTSQDDAVNVWDANYVGVWHLSETSGDRADSLGVSTLTNINSVGSAAGIWGTAADFENSGDEGQQLTHADSAQLSTGDIDFLVEAWAKFESVPPGGGGNRMVTSKYTISGNQREYALHLVDSTGSPTNRIAFIVSPNGTATTEVLDSSTGAPAAGTWYYMQGYHDAAGNVIGVRTNKNTAVTQAHSTGVVDSSAVFTIGGLTGLDPSTYFMDGVVKGVRLSKSLRSESWRDANYNNQSSPTSFWGLGSQETIASTQRDTLGHMRNRWTSTGLSTSFSFEGST